MKNTKKSKKIITEQAKALATAIAMPEMLHQALMQAGLGHVTFGELARRMLKP